MTTITYERVPRQVTRYDGHKLVPYRTVYDYAVKIDGERRATFRNQAVYNRTGFTFEDDTGRHLDSKHHADFIRRPDFDAVVAKNFAKIASRAEIERNNLIHLAEVDNRKWEDDRAKYKLSIWREMMSDALTQYIENSQDVELELDPRLQEKLEAAERELDRVNEKIARS